MTTIDLSEEQVLNMIVSTVRQYTTEIQDTQSLFLVASDIYGPKNHRTWVFATDNNVAIGSIERYWSGLKMICSVMGGSPRTHFFTENGTRTTNKDLKGSGQ